MFTALVLVALITTVMTVPVPSWPDRRDARARAPGEGEPENKKAAATWS